MADLSGTTLHDGSIVLSPALLSHYQAGPAIVRATGQGGMQWLRESPPVVRELAVQIER